MKRTLVIQRYGLLEEYEIEEKLFVGFIAFRKCIDFDDDRLAYRILHIRFVDFLLEMMPSKIERISRAK
jgi:hypothetical protein